MRVHRIERPPPQELGDLLPGTVVALKESRRLCLVCAGDRTGPGLVFVVGLEDGVRQGLSFDTLVMVVPGAFVEGPEDA